MNFQFQIIPADEICKPFPPRHRMMEAESQKEAASVMSQMQMDQPSKVKLGFEDKKKSTWTIIQSRRYVKFLIKSHKLFELDTQKKRLLKVNVKMSQAVKSRSATQCHSHHQKMLKKYGSITGIINSLKELLGSNFAFEIPSRKKEELQQLPIELDEKLLEDFPSYLDLGLEYGLEQMSYSHFFRFSSLDDALDLF